MRYRRLRAKGATWFFTVVTHERQPLLRDPQNISLLRASFRKVMKNHLFTINAAVIMPDHVHVMWTLPPDDNDFSMRWRMIKSDFTHQCSILSKETCSPSRVARKQQAVWQNRFWEHCIRDDEDYANHVAYIHFNPVKHGFVQAPVDWPHSSFHRFVRERKFTAEWGRTEIAFDSTIGRE